MLRAAKATLFVAPGGQSLLIDTAGRAMMAAMQDRIVACGQKGGD